jgi:outer membrane lipoprotein-sorting protein
VAIFITAGTGYTSVRREFHMHRAGLLLLALAILCPYPASALTGREIIDTAQKKNGLSTWKDRRLAATMKTYDGESLVRTREIEVVEQTDPRGEHRTLIDFIGPADVEGTEFLHLSPRGEKDTQWLWTKEMRRARRISEAQQDENFFGTDLSYRDLELLVRIQQWTDAEAPATLEGEETVDGKACNIVALEPKNPEFPWSKYRLWFGKEDFLPWRLDIYDKDGKVAKRIVLGKYERAQDHATPVDVTISQVNDNTKTTLSQRDIRYNTDVGDDLFTVSALGKSD